MLLSYNSRNIQGFYPQKLLTGLYLNNAEAGSATSESRPPNSAEILRSSFLSITIHSPL